MILDATQWSIVWPALVAGLLVTATHVPLGMQVLDRGIVFIDLAIAQVAGGGVILADYLGWEPTGVAVQVSALAAALLCAALLTWTDRRWPEVQEAIIGVVFVVAASLAILLLSKNPHGSEHLKDLLSGQILWVSRDHLPLEALIYGAILAIWFGARHRIGRIGFYGLFACAVTISVQLVGLFLVFCTLVIPGLTTFYSRRFRYLKAYAVAVVGYGVGLIASVVIDAPSGSVIVCTMFVAGLIVAVTTGQRNPGAAGKNPDRAPGEPALQAEATHERSYP